MSIKLTMNLDFPSINARQCFTDVHRCVQLSSCRFTTLKHWRAFMLGRQGTIKIIIIRMC